MSASESRSEQLVAGVFCRLAQLYIKIHRPVIIAVGGSVGKTSSKLALATILESEKNVSYMDDSYNKGLGLYLSVFRLKVPDRSSPLAWVKVALAACKRMVTTHPNVMVLEYGIDSPGDMQEMVNFVQPDISVLTAVTPEHMEFLKDIDTVGKEESIILRAAKRTALVSSVDVDKNYYENINPHLVVYGGKNDSIRSHVVSWSNIGATVDFYLEDLVLKGQKLSIISEPTIRQLSGLLWLAEQLGVSQQGLEQALPRVTAAASRLSLMQGVNDSMIIDDTANFSPDAGVVGLQTLKRIPASRRIALLGNMHELGEFADAGYAEVATEFNDLDMIVLVGDLSTVRFKKLAEKRGYNIGKNLFTKDTSIDAGEWLRNEVLKPGDVVLVKGPFGGWYMEEAVKVMLADPSDARKLTRQSAFWDNKKRAHFGDSYRSASE